MSILAQYTAVGHCGENGPRAQRLVGLEGVKRAVEPVPIPRRNMEECALDRVFRLKRVW